MILLNELISRTKMYQLKMTSTVNTGITGIVKEEVTGTFFDHLREKKLVLARSKFRESDPEYD
jgi:hypothetical protein